MCKNMKELQTVSEKIFELEQKKAKKKKEVDALEKEIKQLKAETSTYMKKRQKNELTVAGLTILFTAFTKASSENYHNTIEHQIIDKLELNNLMDEFDRDNQRKILELLIVGYSQKEIRKLLEINLYRWKKLMTDTKVLVEKYLDEYYND